MIFRRLQQYGKNLTVITVFFFVSIALALANTNTPFVIKTDPAHLSEDIYPIRHIHFWLIDSDQDNSTMLSGINLDSIELWVNGDSKELTLQMQGNEKIWGYTTEIQRLPECSDVVSVLFAEDSKGNRMDPYIFKFATGKIPDQKPPVIYNLSPSPLSTDNVSLPLISCWIEDEDTGVDLDSLILHVNDIELLHTFSELENGYIVYAIPPAPFSFEQWVDVVISVQDFAKNVSEQSWSFRIKSPPPKIPNLFYPSNGALMNYQLEDGTLRFVWQLEKPEHCYRLRIKPSDGLISHLFDLEPGEYWRTDNLAGYNFHLSYSLWYQFSCKESLDWSVAVIDKKDGMIISPFSNWSSVVLAPPNAVVLREPISSSSFGYFSQPPLFVWDKFDNAESYLLGIAKVDFASGFFQNLYTVSLEANATSHRLSASGWKSLGTGFFIWAVIATDKNENLSDFMNFEFNVLSPALINQSLNIY